MFGAVLVTGAAMALFRDHAEAEIWRWWSATVGLAAGEAWSLATVATIGIAAWLAAKSTVRPAVRLRAANDNPGFPQPIALLE